MLVDLKNNVIDCAVMDEAFAKSLIKKVSGLKILAEPLVESEFSFAIAKENPDLLAAVNAALKELKESGTLEKIIDGYQPGGDFRYTSPDNVDLSHGSLTLAVDAAMPPYSYYDDKEQPAGLHIDIARAVCDILHVGLNVAVVDSSELVITVQYGKADFSLGGITDSEENAKLAVFSNPYTTNTQVIVTRR
jgi:polar amino acid transport system substrate-binding protein